MPLSPKTKLGPYELIGQIGAGGMGEVYRARDTRLERTVAIKILPPEFSHNAKQRFEREARTISKLSHPHICTLHDVGREDQIDYLVMEYLEGQTLAERLSKRPLPIDEALGYAVQICDALDKAHRQGIVHRDLKPGNIMLTKHGVKLLDFGLAKWITQGKKQIAAASDEVTARGSLTEQGTILGTVQYMAPEQIEGKQADTRTDIFAFGMVLYEMASGSKAFAGKSRASIMAAILEREPERLSLVAPLIPHKLDRVVADCLAKDPDERWQTAHDLKLQLKCILEGLAEWEPAKAQSTFSIFAFAALFVVAGALVGGLAISRLNPVPVGANSGVTRLVFPVPEGTEIGKEAPNSPSIAVTPDGNQIVFVGVRDGKAQLFLRSLGSREAMALPGTDGANSPFFSPDGQWIGFYAHGKLRKTPISGGLAQPLADAAVGFLGGSWAPDDTIFFVPANLSGIWRVPASGGRPQRVTALDRTGGEITHRLPQVLPGGNAILFTAWTGPARDEHSIHLARLDTGERRVLVQGGTSGRYVATGHLVYFRGDSLMALPFDLQTLKVGSTVPVEVAAGVHSGFEGAAYAISDSGTLVHLAGHPQRRASRLVWVDREGKVEALSAPSRIYGNAAISPDGNYLALDIEGATVDIWIYDLIRGTLTPLIARGSSQRPVWSPDGLRIAYRGTRAGSRNIYWRAADGTGAEHRLTESEFLDTPVSWSADGQWLAFSRTHPITATDISVMPLGEDQTPQVFLATRAQEGQAQFSPNGDYIAYTSDESGRAEVYVRPFNQTGGHYPVSTGGGDEPVWSPDGSELFYRIEDKLMVVDVTTAPGFKAGAPRPLFTGRFNPGAGAGPGYSVAPDGKRFVFVQPILPEEPHTHIHVVLNWFEELKTLLEPR